ncbi:glycerophosphodiester phosphodiesterase family protein [Rummeliibacillus pycnus]|uniref:glycerophosphodiester phosphodiesterase family protein n=1 Tax=Rummeliibacillus pycnus TaxID=101070 RepID=UPI001FEA46A4|nr:glycerophosphodiester phosphodiesterase family protein [Rummeliibacillus pycnus]
MGIFTISVIKMLSFSTVQANRSIMVIAHRGANDKAPEETMPAYKIAVQEKANYIEMDLRETKDNQLVLMHDPTIDRTTNGKGEVNQYRLQELKKFDAGSWFNQKYKNERIITLEELINHFGSKTNYFIETRLVDHKLKMEKTLVEILNRKGLIQKHKVIIESFSAMSLKRIHDINDNIPLVQLILCKNQKDITAEKINQWKKYAIGIGLSSDLVNQSLINNLHQNHLKVYPFFFNTQTELAEQKRVIKDGADGVFTNHINDTQSLLK